jgi:hypothetical protein
VSLHSLAIENAASFVSSSHRGKGDEESALGPHMPPVEDSHPELSPDQKFLKACCIVLTLARFDFERCGCTSICFSVCTFSKSHNVAHLAGSVFRTALESTGLSLHEILLRNSPPFGHALFSSFVFAVSQLLAPADNLPNFHGVSPSSVVVEAVSSVSAGLQKHPSTAAGAFSPEWLICWRWLFEGLSAEIVSESSRALVSDVNALLAMCVLCVFDPMELWLDVTCQCSSQSENCLLMNRSIALAAAASRLLQSGVSFDNVRVKASAEQAWSRSATATSSALIESCVCLHNGWDGCSSAFSDPSSVVVSMADSIVFHAMLEAPASALVRVWWDTVIAAYGSTPLVACHVNCYMRSCHSAAGLVSAIQYVHRCIPTMPLISSMFLLCCCHNAPYSHLRSFEHFVFKMFLMSLASRRNNVSRTVLAWDRALKISESYSPRDSGRERQVAMCFFHKFDWCKLTCW